MLSRGESGRRVRIGDAEVLVNGPEQLEEEIRRLAREQGVQTFTVEVDGHPVKPEELRSLYTEVQVVRIRRYMVGAAGKGL